MSMNVELADELCDCLEENECGVYLSHPLIMYMGYTASQNAKLSWRSQTELTEKEG